MPVTSFRRILSLTLPAAVFALLLAGLTGAPGSAPAAAGAVSGAASGQHRVLSPAALGGPNTTTDYTSHNWAGYFTTAASHGSDFTAVSTQWVEPAVTCNSLHEVGGFWVGFDGWWNGSVEQGGTVVECLNGSATHHVWWEMYPYNDVQESFAISAGDTIQASVVYTASTKTFTITVKDVTSGRTLSQAAKCHTDQNGCPRSTAEVISEDIGGGNDTDGLFYLPNYGSVLYNNSSVTDTSGHTGTLSDSAWQLGLVTEVSSTNITKQTTSAVDSTGASFSNVWHHD